MNPRRPILPLLLTLLLTACTPSSTPTAATAPATTQAATSTKPRIVSTVPAATLNLVLIGAADTLVGVTKYDHDILPEAQKDLPPVGDYQTMNYEALVQLKPTAVIIQLAEHRIEPRLRDMAQRYHFQLVNIRMDTVSDMFTTALRLGAISNHEPQAQLKIDLAKAELAEIARQVAPRNKPKVVYIAGSNPMFIVGGHTFLDEMITAAGGQNAGAQVGDLWPTIGREALVQLAPEVILIGSPGEPAQTVNDPRTELYLRLPIPAAKSGRVFIVSDFNGQQASVDIGRQVRDLSKLIYAATPDAIAPTTEPQSPKDAK